MARLTGRRSARAGGGAAQRSRGSRSGEDDNEEVEAEVYEVEAVVAKRQRKGATEYLVQWKGFTERTWEPERNLSCDELIREYERQYAGADRADGVQNSPLSNGSVEDPHRRSEKERANRFLLVADDWGTEPSVVLVLHQQERQQLEQSDAPFHLQRVTVDAQFKSVALHPCDVEVVGGATLPSSARLVAARVVEDEELAMYVAAVAGCMYLLSANKFACGYLTCGVGPHSQPFLPACVFRPRHRERRR